MGSHAEALVAAGWLGRNDAAAEQLASISMGTDVLPLLAGAACRASEHPSSKTIRGRPGNCRRLAWAEALTRAVQRGARLTWGWPGAAGRLLAEWIGSRWLWWPRGVPEGRTVAWVSSRLGRAIDERPDWLAVLRSAAAKVDAQRDLLLTVPGTTVDQFLERAVVLFGLRRLRVHLDEGHSLEEWLKRCRRQIVQDFKSRMTAEPGLAQTDVFVSPPDFMTVPVSHHSSLPLRDRVLIAAADQVFALQVRPNGNLHRMLRARLSDSRWAPASVWLALGDSLIPPEIACELQSLGAVGWWLFSPDDADGRETASPRHCQVHKTPCEAILRAMPWRDGEYFVHWTRRRDGPWPGQTETEFWEEVWLSREAANHSALATLSRIVQQQRLTASGAGIRGGFAVVSFSANSLAQVLRQRTFRAHRGRWDAEGYGLCVRRDWLQAQGAKPVVYGDDALWPTLADSDRPFFQLRTTRARRGVKPIDWSAEAEWRVPHDVDLSAAGRDDVVLFVPSEEEARQLTAISRWPVCVVSVASKTARSPRRRQHGRTCS